MYRPTVVGRFFDLDASSQGMHSSKILDQLSIRCWRLKGNDLPFERLSDSEFDDSFWAIDRQSQDKVEKSSIFCKESSFSLYVAL